MKNAVILDLEKYEDLLNEIEFYKNRTKRETERSDELLRTLNEKGEIRVKAFEKAIKHIFSNSYTREQYKETGFDGIKTWHDVFILTLNSMSDYDELFLRKIVDREVRRADK